MTRRSSHAGSRVTSPSLTLTVKDKTIHSRRRLEESTLSEGGSETMRLRSARRRSPAERAVPRRRVPGARPATTPECLSRIGTLQRP